MRTGILFDLDGTLLDTLQDLHLSTNRTLLHFGCPERTIDEIRSFVGNGARNQIRLSLPGRDTDPDLDEAVAYYQADYKCHCTDHIKPYDGILEVLATLGKAYPLAVVTNKPDAAAKLLCKQVFGDIFALGATEECPRKPSAEMVYKAMAAIGVDRCIYIGDSEVDVLTAKNAGVPCISVLWGFRDKACLEDAGATVFCQHPAQLPDVIETLIKERIRN